MACLGFQTVCNATAGGADLVYFAFTLQFVHIADDRAIAYFERLVNVGV